MDESAGFDNFLYESRGSELMESLHKVCVHYNVMCMFSLKLYRWSLQA